MERDELQKAAVGAVVAAGLVAVASGRLPRWLRIAVVLAAAVVAGGAGLYGYRFFTTPKTLTLAAGSADGDMPKLMSAIAARMAANGTPVRLKVVDKGNVLEAMKAFSAGEVDLTVGRGDVGDLSEARSVVAITNNVVLIVTPPGSPVKEIEDLKGKVVGVVGGVVNHQLVEALKKEYELDRLKVTFKDLPLPEIATAFTGKHVAALLVVMPVTEKYLSLLRSIIPSSKQKPGLVAIEAAGAIAEVARAYESWDLPKGTLRGSPPIPDDDLTTLRVPFYLLAKRKLDDDTATALAKAVMETRRELIGEFPILAQISAPSTDKDAFVPVHPGAAAYFDGDTKTFFDKYGDQIFYGSMLLGSLTSLFAAAWKFMVKDARPAERSPMARLCALSDRIEEAGDEAALTDLERQIDGILRGELDKIAARDPDAAEPSALTLATYRLERLIALQRARLRGEPQPLASA
jgi:TRAP transporter TAXI family solute receptor